MINPKYLLLLITLLFSSCAKSHKSNSAAAESAQDGDGVQNGGGTLQFYSYTYSVIRLSTSIYSPNFIYFVSSLRAAQKSPYNIENEQLWIENFKHYENLGFQALSEADDTYDWFSYSEIKVPIAVKSNLTDGYTGAPLMAANTTKPAKIYLTPHVWVRDPRTNIVPCEEGIPTHRCQEIQLATISVHEKLGALGFIDEQSGKYRFSKIVYKHLSRNYTP